MSAIEWSSRREQVPLSLAGARVLVLEDDVIQRETVLLLLQNLGVRQIEVASSGEEALQRLNGADSGFDLTLCDLCVLDKNASDGVQFIRMAASRPIGALVLMSGVEADVLHSAGRLALEAGVSKVERLRKPVTQRELERVMRRVLAGAPASHRSPVAARSVLWTREALETALRRREFLACFQPKIALATGRLAGMEILCRWVHPFAGVVPPGDFIPIMEREGLIDALTEQMFMQGLDAVYRWKQRGLTVPVAINVSPLTLQKIGLTNRWRSLLAKRGLSADMVTVELTETAAPADFQGLLETVTRLRIHGFGVSLDDFGNGYSSMQLLSDLPITEVKIDRSFVSRVPHEERSVLILDTILDLARKLKLDVVAEGIETAEAADFLRSAGCQLGQGYFFGRPAPFHQVRLPGPPQDYRAPDSEVSEATSVSSPLSSD